MSGKRRMVSGTTQQTAKVQVLPATVALNSLPVPKSPTIIRPFKSTKDLRPADVAKINSPVRSPSKSPNPNKSSTLKDPAYAKKKITEDVIAAIGMEFGMTQRASSVSGIVYGKIDIVKAGGQRGQLTLFSADAVEDFIKNYT